MLDLSYDRQFDILYLDIADSSQSYGAEQIDCVNVFRDLDSDLITGFMIFGFMDKFLSHKLPEISEPFAINFEQDIIPKLSL